ncbi:hypothetical protein [Egbenema bharatensis]|uniref:hypothetical protein n=1 Tax=Egbenema bharatensis TaxID=3463334 RepID=UPI003A843415
MNFFNQSEVRSQDNEQLVQKFDFAPPKLVVYAIAGLWASIMHGYLLCAFQFTKIVIWGLWAIWGIVLLFAFLSMWGNAQAGRPPIGASEARVVFVLLALLVATAVGFGLETVRGHFCLN